MTQAGPLPDRRRFLMLMGLACASSTLVHPAAALTQALPATAAASADSLAANAVSKPPSSEARALAEVVRLRYGSDLGEAQLEAIAQNLDNRLESGRALRKLAFANADEPDITFHA
jgi:hypothetical protein